ncbi:DNA translocase FtsK, partial [uncultured Alistipes sp.]|uniref:DNA translocase FtsK n=1 Tax=uncultured Alistipes sp. TaxID=538949 RepID=UPI002583C89B
VRIVRQRPLLFNHSILSLFLIMILGSLTLGFAFADRWSLCCSTGWGGAFGIASSALLRTHIGAFGTLILLVGGWILTGVFINRNFINKVNEAGNVVVDKSGKVVEILKHKVVLHGRAAGEDGAAEDVPEPAPKPGPKAAAPQPAPSKAAEPAAQKPAPIRVERPSEPVAARKSAPEEDENPFLELTPDGKPVAGETAAEQAPPPAEDGEFIEVDLSRPEGRVVIGRSGLVELERPAVRDAVAAEPAPEEVPERELAQSDSDAPFTEITVLDDAPAAEPEGVVVTVEANEAKLLDEKAIPTESYDPLKDLVNYRKPPVTLLEDYISDSEVSDEEIFENKTKIEDTLKNFGIPIQRIKATVGPTVTLYEIVQAQGIKISKVQGLENDIAQSLKALGIRIIAPIPGKGTIGIEVPNRDKQVVSMYSAVRSLRFQESKAELPVVIGRTIQNENYVFDLAKMPHLLVAGATGQGKSVGLNAIITSLLYRKHPAQLKFVMIDPKMVEFSLYAKIERHFLAKMESEDDAIITDPKKAVYTLNSLCTEMDNRLELCKKAGARNIAEYNEKFTSRRLNPMNGHRYLPYIVVVVDEFADLIMTAREVEGPVMRLAQKARAIGIHLIIATQRPDVKVITGGIKANFPARIAFRVMQMIDSRTIIDQPGANQLIGRGDMLFSKDGDLTRIQCALVETREVERICEYISKQQGYTEAYTLPDYTPDGGDAQMGSEESSAPVKYDSLFAEIARDAVSGGQISTSMIQRNYEVGFNRAGRIMMQLERAGIVGRQQGAKPRDILYHDLPSLEAKLQELGLF